MAKKLRFNYTFSPGAANVGTVVLSGYVSLKRLLLVTNVTRNIILFNFGDTSAGASLSYNSTTDQTTITLAKDTSSMSSTDNLQIFVEEDAVEFVPNDTYADPVNKFRVSTPQALIDTDFEYGVQNTKWESQGFINNINSAYFGNTGIGTNIVINSITMSGVATSKLVTVGLSLNPSGLVTTGQPIVVTDSYLGIANGIFTVDAVVGSGNTLIQYKAKAANTTGITSILDVNRSGINTGTFFTGSSIGISTLAFNTTGFAVTVTTRVPHGLSLGNEILVRGIPGIGTTVPNGSFTVASVVGPSTFTYYTDSQPLQPAIGIASVHTRPQSLFLHRAFDGGVIFGINSPSNNSAAVRQTRRYFRYQSGKGVQISSGTLLKPNLQVDSITSIGATVTVQTREIHNILGLVPGSQVIITGVNESAYNGTFTVENVIYPNRFTYNAASTPSSTIASGNYNVSISNWYGSQARLGAFDQQNGLFFEFDGQQLYAVRRNSTYQIAGRSTVVGGSCTVTESNSNFRTYYSKQLSVNDFVNIKGQSYRVTGITSDNSMTISPAYRVAGITSFCQISKVTETRIPQSQWNIDKCDGTGPSGYNLDLTRMQMFYIDYSWYGAGFVRWGVRGPNGNVIYCHKMPNNNLNYEAYMRSGNLPARYEVSTYPAYTTVTNSILSTDTYVGIASTAGFPSTGTVVIRNNNNYEYVNYTGIGSTALTGVTRARSGVTTSQLQLTGIVTGQTVATVAAGFTNNLQIGMRIISIGGTGFPENTFVAAIGVNSIRASQAATAQNPLVIIPPMGSPSPIAFTTSSTSPTIVELAYPTFSPTISHWGTSFMMDGRYDDDKSLVFTYGQPTITTIPAQTSRALFAIRVAPSVDNGLIGAFGQREVINRMQLILRALDISTRTSNTNLLVRAILNGLPSSPAPWTSAVGSGSTVTGASFTSSLAQIADYSNPAQSVTVSGGEVTAGFFVGSGANSIDLSQVRDLGNSIVGGGSTNTTSAIYPDGPDVLHIVVTNLNASTSADVLGRISWTEAQA